jgi:hypothetical protein
MEEEVWHSTTPAALGRGLFGLVAGQDTEFRRVATVWDENATVTGLPPGAEVKVRVIGANKVGEGPASEPVSARVPALAVAA